MEFFSYSWFARVLLLSTTVTTAAVFIANTILPVGAVPGATPLAAVPEVTSSPAVLPPTSVQADQLVTAVKRALQTTGEMRLKSRGKLGAGNFSLSLVPGFNVLCASPTDVEMEFALPSPGAGAPLDRRVGSGKIKFSPALRLANSAGIGVSVSNVTISDNSVRCDGDFGATLQSWINAPPTAVTAQPLTLDSFTSLSVDELFWKPASGQSLAIGPAEENSSVSFGPETTILVSNLKRLADRTFSGSIKVKIDSLAYETSNPAPSKFAIRSIDTSFDLAFASAADLSTVEISKPADQHMVKLEGVEAIAVPGRLQLAKADMAFNKLGIVMKRGQSPEFTLKSTAITCEGVDVATADGNYKLNLISSRIDLPGSLIVKGRSWHLDGATVKATSAKAKASFPNKTFELPVIGARVSLGALNGNEVSEDFDVLGANITVAKDWIIFPENKVRSTYAMPINLVKNAHFHIDQSGNVASNDWQARMIIPRLLFDKDEDHFELDDADILLTASVNSGVVSTISFTGGANRFETEKPKFKPSKLAKDSISISGKVKVDRTNNPTPKIFLENTTVIIPAERLNGVLTVAIPKNIDLAGPDATVTDSGVSQLIVEQVKPDNTDLHLRAKGILHKGIAGPRIIGNPLRARRMMIDAQIKSVEVDNLANGKLRFDPVFGKLEVRLPGFFPIVTWILNKTELMKAIANGFVDRFREQELSPPDFVESLVLQNPELSAKGIKLRFACELRN